MMAKELDCGDIMKGCDHKMRGETESEVMAKASQHAREQHGIEKMDPKTTELVRSKIRNV
jgi:predicted small metal-binding protein